MTGKVGSGAEHSFRPRSVTLAVCTYRRPELFAKFVQSVLALDLPPDVDFRLVVADNNKESQREAYIGRLLADLPFHSLYGHEPSPGYSNARNMALTLALQTEAEIIGFVDDDLTLHPDWLKGLLQSYAEFPADVIGGAVDAGGSIHRRWFTHGKPCDFMGTRNVSFKRWLIDKTGPALRFDPRFNQTGGEDQAFFAEAVRHQARIVYSHYSLVHDDSLGGEMERAEELANKARTSSAMERNKIVRLRAERGLTVALLTALWGCRFGVKAMAGYADSAASRLIGNEQRATAKKFSGDKNLAKLIEGFRGLSGDVVARYDVRRSH